MHYYQFNIGDYTSHTARLSLYEDLAYRRLLDLYYLNERPFNECSKSVAREIGMVDQLDSVQFVLSKYFALIDGFWTQPRVDKEISDYHNKLKSASKAGKASAKARRLKASEQVSNDRSTTVQPNIKHKPLTINQEPLNIVKDNGDFDLVWSMYEKKGNRKTSLLKFNKLSDSNKKLIIEHLPKYVSSTPDKQFRKNLETYINQECWNDEIPVSSRQISKHDLSNQNYQSGSF